MSQSNQQKEVFNNWVNLYSDSLLSWAIFKISDKGLAEDIVQETFLSAFKAFDKFKGDSNPKTWLFRILNNKIIDYYRKSSRRMNHIEDINAIQITDGLFDENNAWQSNGFETQWDDELHLLDKPEFNMVLDECIKDLPENWRTAVLSKYILEKNSKEICQELNISPSNYWQMVHRAKLMLKKCIEIKWFK